MHFQNGGDVVSTGCGMLGIACPGLRVQVPKGIPL